MTDNAPRQEGFSGERVEPSVSFECWLEETARRFAMLSSEEQTVTLNELIRGCGSEQLWHLQQTLPDFLFRDFVSLLPQEINEKILGYVDAPSLLDACKVSQTWNQKICALKQLWKSKALWLGCISESEYELKETEINWKQRCVKTLQTREKLLRGSAWDQDDLVRLLRSPARFSAVDHNGGHVAGGTADSGALPAQASESVVIWSVHDGQVDVSFPVTGSVSCIKLLYPTLVVCGHFDGSLSSYKVGDPMPGELANRYRLHTAPVLSLDLRLSCDLLVSGSADCSAKVWSLSTGVLLKTLPNQSHWVLTTILSESTEHSVEKLKGRHLMLTMTRDDIQMFSWHPSDSSEREEEQGSCDRKPQLCDIGPPDLYIPLKSVTEAVQSFFFTPGLHFDGSRISFIRQMPMFDTQAIGDADFVTVDAADGKLLRTLHINQKIRKLLAIGRRFAVVLLPYVDDKYKNLALVDLQRNEIVGGANVPHSRASTPDFSQITMGDTSWLDGLSEDNASGLVACLALSDATVHVITWSDKRNKFDTYWAASLTF